MSNFWSFNRKVSYLVEKVLNSYQYRDQKTCNYMKRYIPSNGIDERLQCLESQLSMNKAVPKNVYQRLKHLEDRLLHLESLSPEYLQFWVCNTNGKKLVWCNPNF